MTSVQEFQLTLREAIFQAEKLKRVSWPDLPVIMPLKVIVGLLVACAPLESALGKAIDAVSEHIPDDSETLFHLGQVIS